MMRFSSFSDHEFKETHARKPDVSRETSGFLFMFNQVLATIGQILLPCCQPTDFPAETAKDPLLALVPISVLEQKGQLP